MITKCMKGECFEVMNGCKPRECTVCGEKFCSKLNICPKCGGGKEGEGK